MAVLDWFVYWATINASSAAQAVGKSRGMRSPAQRIELNRPVEHDRDAE